MIGELVCPDCGGVVGATERTEAGEPCRCFANRRHDGAASSPELSGGLSGVTDADSSGGSDANRYDPAADVVPVATVVAAKLCRDCGTDLTGHRRYKDASGAYQCAACREAEQKREHFGRVPCPVCGQLTKEEKLTDYEGTRMCPDCHTQRGQLRKAELQRIGFTGARRRHELHHVYLLLAVAAALGVIVTIGILIKG